MTLLAGKEQNSRLLHGIGKVFFVPQGQSRYATVIAIKLMIGLTAETN